MSAGRARAFLDAAISEIGATDPAGLLAVVEVTTEEQEQRAGLLLLGALAHSVVSIAESLDRLARCADSDMLHIRSVSP